MNLRSLLVPDADRLLSGNLYTLYHKFLDAQQLLDAGMVAEAWSALASIVRDAELLGCKLPVFPAEGSVPTNGAQWRKTMAPRTLLTNSPPVNLAGVSGGSLSS